MNCPGDEIVPILDARRAQCRCAGPPAAHPTRCSAAPTRHHRLMSAGSASPTIGGAPCVEPGCGCRSARRTIRHASTEPTFELRLRAGLGWLGREPPCSRPRRCGGWASTSRNQTGRPSRSTQSEVARQRAGSHTTTARDPVDFTRHRRAVRSTTAARAIIDMARPKGIGPSDRAGHRQRRSWLAAPALPTLRDRVAALEGARTIGVRAAARVAAATRGGESYLERRFLRLDAHRGYCSAVVPGGVHVGVRQADARRLPVR